VEEAAAARRRQPGCLSKELAFPSSLSMDLAAQCSASNQTFVDPYQASFSVQQKQKCLGGALPAEKGIALQPRR